MKTRKIARRTVRRHRSHADNGDAEKNSGKSLVTLVDRAKLNVELSHQGPEPIHEPTVWRHDEPARSYADNDVYDDEDEELEDD